MVLDGSEKIVIGTSIEIGYPVRITIDNSEGLIKLYENVTPPEDYKGKRYCFDGVKWTFNQDWRNPNLTAVKR